MRGVSCVACSRPPATRRSLSFSRSALTLLGVAPRGSGERARLHLGQAVAFSPCGTVSFPRFAPAKPSVLVNLFTQKVGALAGLGQTELSSATVFAMSSPHNMSVNTDAQGRPLPLVAPLLGRRLPSRYVALGRFV
jgi:hypothetical protein